MSHKSFRRALSIFLCLTLLASHLLVAFAAGPAYALTISGPQYVKAGNTLTVTVAASKVYDAKGLMAIGVRLFYDKDRLTYQSVTRKIKEDWTAQVANNATTGVITVLFSHPYQENLFYDGDAFVLDFKFAVSANAPAGTPLLFMIPEKELQGTDSQFNDVIGTCGDFESAIQRDVASVAAPPAITLESGAPKTVEGLKLPETLALTLDNGQIVDAAVSWAVEACAYNPALFSAQDFTVDGTVILPSYVSNTGNLPLAVSVDVAVAAKDHIPGMWNVTRLPTCTEEGLMVLNCIDCGEVLDTEVIPALGHDWSAWTVTTPATCTETGVETRTCSRCDEIETRTLPKIDHTAGEWTVTLAATCTEAGSKNLVCTVCGEVLDTEVIPALGHDWSAWTVTTPATCTETGVETRTCSRCDEIETRTLPKIDHTAGEWTVTLAATCTEAGSKNLVCTVCGEVLDTEVIPALGHDWDDGVVTVPPTTEAVGEMTYTCTRCEKTKTEVIPMLSTYRIDVVRMENGSVTPSKTSAEAGETITLAVFPAEGYRLVEGSLKANGAPVTDKSFSMPSESVTITAEFEPITTPVVVVKLQIPTKVTLKRATTMNLMNSVQVTPVNADANLRFASSNPTVVGVNASGVLMGLRTGSAVIVVQDLNTGLAVAVIVTVT